MKSAPKPKTEKKRIAALRRLNILDTLPEQSYDDITQIASHICQTPIALVSLVDESRQWFKSKVGLGASETPRDLAFCAHAILGSEVFYIPDATRDERFSDNPLVVGAPNVIFYAGAPIESGDGHKIGTLCVIDSKPRHLSEEQKDALTRLSRQVSALLQLRLKNEELKAEQEIAMTMTQFFELSIDIMCVANIDGTFRMVSPAFSETLGYKKHELEGKPFASFIHPEDQTSTMHIVEKLTQGAKVVNFRNRYRKKNGKWLILSWTVAPSKNGNLYAIARNVTEEVEQQEQLKHSHEEISAYQKALDSNYIVAKTTIHGRISYLNENLCKISGYSREELIGQDHRLLNSGHHSKEFFALMWRTIKSGKVWRGQIKNKKKNGQHYWVDTSISPIFDQNGELKEFLAIRNDITNEIAQKDAALKASQAKSAFLANMSHELRTPMNAIIGYSDLLIEDLDSSQKEAIGDVKKIKSSGEHLLSLINQILDISKVEAGKIEIYQEPVLLNELTEKIECIVKPLLAKNNNSLHFDLTHAPITLETDRDKFHQILINLLSNATKFTKGGRIDLRIFKEKDKNNSWVVAEVSDNGIGIPADKLEHIFLEFAQADESTTRQYGGTGLGLSICRKFANLLGGSLTVKSIIGKGSTFTVRLPDLANGQSRDQSASASASATAPLILIIDDDSAARELCRRSLANEGYEIIEAKNADAGIALALERVPDLITLDVMMPGKDGWETLSQLKENEITKDIPVVMVSMVENKNVGFTLGASEFLVKPVDKDRLKNIVKNLLSISETDFVMVVEDDDNARTITRKSLERAGFKVAEATNGAEALTVFEQIKPKVIILDIMMPVMNGFDFIDELRSRGWDSECEIIVLSAKTVTGSDRAELMNKVKQIAEKGRLSSAALIKDVRRMLNSTYRKSKRKAA